MYPHLVVNNVGDVIEEAKRKGYRVVQKPRKYNWGTEAFLCDPDGYVWALVTLKS